MNKKVFFSSFNKEDKKVYSELCLINKALSSIVFIINSKEKLETQDKELLINEIQEVKEKLLLTLDRINCKIKD